VAFGVTFESYTFAHDPAVFALCTLVVVPAVSPLIVFIQDKMRGEYEPPMRCMMWCRKDTHTHTHTRSVPGSDTHLPIVTSVAVGAVGYLAVDLKKYVNTVATSI
jgi:hypothetical protein